MSADRNEQLLREATELAREGDKAGARRLVKQILNKDDTNVKAWMLLYRVSEDRSEKRQALTRILELDPGNVRAQEALDKLDTRIQQAEEEEVAPGIGRGQLTRIIVALVLLTVIVLGGVFAVIAANNASRANEFAERTRVVVESTNISATETAFIVQQTQSAADATATFFAENSPTPTPTNTRVGPPTLPPTFTPTATLTPNVSPTPLPPPADAIGEIIAAGGPDLLNDGYYHLYALPANGGEPRQLTTDPGDRGRSPAGVDPTRIVYTIYSRATFEYSLASFNVTSGEIAFLSPLWANSPLATGQNLFLRADEAAVSRGGNLVAFTGETADNRRQLYIFDFNDLDGDPLRLPVVDQNTYNDPAFSPDGQRIIAVRSETAGGNVDLFQIDINAGQLQPITTDGIVTLESMPQYHPTQNEIVYAAKTSAEGNNDIFIRAADGTGQALNISRTDNADELHPVYSPDGRYIAFSSNRTGAYNVYVYDRNNGALSQLTSGNDNYYNGTWIE
jgi:hypothetical protein